MRKLQSNYRFNSVVAGLFIYLALISTNLAAEPLRNLNSPGTSCVSDSAGLGLQRAAERLLKWSEKHPIEKVHLHFDKSYYAVSDTLWFKAYISSGPHRHFSGLSRLLYVELIGPDNKLLKGITLPAAFGVAWGDLSLAEPLVPGHYRLRAYTNWMRNAGEEYFFDRSMEIGGFRENEKKPVKKIRSKPMSETTDVQFFPEGGNLLAGINSKVAFKAVSENGLAAEITGMIEDANNQRIGDLKTQHAGMGKFNLLALKGASYQVRVRFADGSEKVIPLPKAKDRGYALSVNEGDDLIVKITVDSTTFRENKGRNISLVGQSGGTIFYASEGPLQGSEFTTIIPKGRFPSGMTQLTLFDHTGTPVNERPVFILHDDQMKLSVKSNKVSYGPGDVVKLELKANDSEEKPLIGAFSVSVINADLVPYDELSEHTILTDLLLASDLKGYIEKPNYYFTEKSPRKRGDLDLLMLTQGYRKIEWKKVLSESVPEPKYAPEQMLSVSGTLKTLSGKPISNGKVMLLGPEMGLYLERTSDRTGKFSFNDLVFADSLGAIIQAQKSNGRKDLEIKLTRRVPPVIASTVIPGPDSAQVKSMNSYLQTNKVYYESLAKRSIALKEVTIKAAPKVKYHTSNLGGEENYDRRIIYEQIRDFGGPLSTRLAGKLGSIFFINGWPHDPKQMMAPMNVIVDGVFLDPEITSSIDEYNADDISSVEVLTSPHTAGMYGIRGGRGILILNTKRGNEYEAVDTFVPGMLRAKLAGYYLARTFYTPKYTPASVPPPTIDGRSTVYWNPHFLTDKSGSAAQSFGALKRGTYRIIVEGLGFDGSIGRAVYYYEVR